jgi:hypothetical protein
MLQWCGGDTNAKIDVTDGSDQLQLESEMMGQHVKKWWGSIKVPRTPGMSAECCLLAPGGGGGMTGLHALIHRRAGRNDSVIQCAAALQQQLLLLP